MIFIRNDVRQEISFFMYLRERLFYGEDAAARNKKIS